MQVVYSQLPVRPNSRYRPVYNSVLLNTALLTSRQTAVSLHCKIGFNLEIQTGKILQAKFCSGVHRLSKRVRRSNGLLDVIGGKISSPAGVSGTVLLIATDGKAFHVMLFGISAFHIHFDFR